jgi:hypothetical protein
VLVYENSALNILGVWQFRVVVQSGTGWISALPPKADIGTQPRDVRFVPEADIRVVGKPETLVPKTQEELLKTFADQAV